jgi:hypothetical protein
VDAWRGDAVLVDVDGTLVDVSSVRHHVILTHPENRGYRDYDAFHRSASWCPPIRAVVDAVAAEKACGRAVLIMTARKEAWKPHTIGWLDGLVEWEEIYMRADCDDRPDAAVKADLLRKVRARGWNVVRAYDDNPSIIKLWKMEGIPVIEVPGWYPE